MKKILLFAIAGLFTAGLAFGQSITVTAPNGGEHWIIGSTQQITWSHSGVSGNVRINLVNAGGGAFGTIVAAVPVADGHYAWTVGQLTTGPVPAGEYRIGLYASNQDVDDRSDATFSIISPAVGLSIQTPSGGESWEIGSTQPITWTALNIAANCRLILLKNDQILGTIRDSFAPGQGGGSWNWTVGNYAGGLAPIGSGYKVRIQTVSNAVIYSAQSANSFSIFIAKPITKPIIFHPIENEFIRLRIELPDLVVCLIWNGSRPMVQQDKRIKVRVKNIGKGAAPATTCNLYVEGHGTRSIPVPALAANTEFIIYSQQFKWATLGHKTVRTTVDPAGQVKEANENNNKIEKSIKVISPHLNRYVLSTDICSDQN
ncbi:MAG: hypothetical protein MUP71_13370 [Candidatus Aminicenantes bacterium]|nr:hypothetical protein [Candidatus Aminicenantes bacterium]